MKQNLKFKFLATLVAWLIAFNPLVVPIVWAEGEDGTPGEEQVVEMEVIDEPPAEETVQDGTSSQSSGEGDSAITTGDAESLAEVDTTVNTSLDCVDGEITTPDDPCSPPEAEGDPECGEISHDNTAEVSGEAASTATTGQNVIQGAEGDALINTGNATAGASLENEINTNVVSFEETEELTGCNPVTAEVVINNENEAVLENDANVLADTGENQANGNEGKATILTGDALAWANLLNFLNTNIVASDFEILILDLLEEQNGNINLNKLWKEILEKGGEDSLELADDSNFANLKLLVKNQNEAELENNVAVVADSGQNQANENEGNAQINTGDATALANVSNFVNTNIVGSKFFFGVINVFGSFEGNLILPRPELFENGSGNGGQGSQAVFQNQNQATLSDQVTSLAQTGQNEENNNKGNNLIQTGNAQAQANTLSFVNLNIQKNNWLFLIVNHLGSRVGKILNWGSPGEEANPEEGSQIFQLGMADPTPEVGIEIGSQDNLEIENEVPLLTFENENQATVKNNITTQALTGQNQANGNEGDAEIKTGNARSLSNLINFINTNILGGRFFFGLVNVLGDWRGDTVFAYPDVTVLITDGQEAVSPGETVEYNLIYKNLGDDEAGSVVVSFELPEGLSFLGDSCGTANVSGSTYSWLVGTLQAGEEGGCNIQVQVEPDFSGEEKLSLLERLIPKAYAAENGTSVTVIASIGTVDPESDTGNNTATETTMVIFPIPEEEKVDQEGVDNRLPVLEISAWNNVNEFVYPGDTVTFEVKIKNKSGVTVHDVFLTQGLYNGVPGDFGSAGFEIGDLEPGKGGTLSFGLKLADDGEIPPGPYYTLAQASGFAPNGTPVSSNQARTDFEVRSKAISSLFEAKAVEKEDEGEILGVLQDACDQDQDENLLPYVLLFLLSSLWISQRSRRYFGVKS